MLRCCAGEMRGSGLRLRMGDFPGRMVVPWNVAGR